MHYIEMKQNKAQTVIIIIIVIYRRKRIFSRQDIGKLLEEKGITSSDLMPIADTTSHSLINNNTNTNGAKTTPSPTFPSFLPLEVFDDTEYDCRTPEEWLALGST